MEFKQRLNGKIKEGIFSYIITNGLIQIIPQQHLIKKLILWRKRKIFSDQKNRGIFTVNDEVIFLI